MSIQFANYAALFFSASLNAATARLFCGGDEQRLITGHTGGAPRGWRSRGEGGILGY